MDNWDAENGPAINTEIDSSSIYHDASGFRSREDQGTRASFSVTGFANSQVGSNIPNIAPVEPAVPPPLIIALTVYRLSCLSAIVGLGVPKAVAAARGQPAANTSDWVISILVAVVCVLWPCSPISSSAEINILAFTAGCFCSDTWRIHALKSYLGFFALIILFTSFGSSLLSLCRGS